jgi:hypothetical protein
MDIEEHAIGIEIVLRHQSRPIDVLIVQGKAISNPRTKDKPLIHPGKHREGG